MPLRGLFYFAELYKHLVQGENIYGTRLIPLPTPIYLVFYNGEREMGDYEEMKLSDAFVHGNEQSGMELKVKVINIKYGMNQDLMEKCRTLADYAFFVGQVKNYMGQMELKEAILQAIDECIREGRMAEFLKSRRDEVMNSLLTEYDEEKTLAANREEAFKEGIERGLQEGREKGLQEGIEKGIEEGIEKGLFTGICAFIQDYLEDGKTKEEIIDKLIKRFSMSREEALNYYTKCVK